MIACPSSFSSLHHLHISFFLHNRVTSFPQAYPSSFSLSPSTHAYCRYCTCVYGLNLYRVPSARMNRKSLKSPAGRQFPCCPYNVIRPRNKEGLRRRNGSEGNPLEKEEQAWMTPITAAAPINILLAIAPPCVSTCVEAFSDRGKHMIYEPTLSC